MQKQLPISLLFYSFTILMIGYFTYFAGYKNPPHEFWDENYHVASAQKYLDGVMYMEPHPPLGKLFIALGEYIFEPNKNMDVTSFDKTDYIKSYPPNYSFEGMRFFPSLFAMFNGLLFFYILYFIFKKKFLAFLFSSLYLFDNAMIVHSRSAMLESTQMFFILSSILYFLYMVRYKKLQFKDYAILGLIMGFNLSVKLNGLIIILLFSYLLFEEYKSSLIQGVLKIFTGLALMSVVFVSFMYIHTVLGQNMPTHTSYSASQEYKDIIKNGEVSSLSSFPIMLKDNLTYMANYGKGVPRFNACKEGENGSLAYTWPFGNKTINYRWEKNNNEVKYLYLMPNPIIWFLGVAGVLFSLVLIGSRYIYGITIKNQETFYLITLFSGMYLSYMFIMVQIERVMYLYHYFIPLLFSFILIALVFKYIFEEYMQDKFVMLSLGLITIAIFLTYNHFAPLSYYGALDYQHFLQRIWFDFWQLKAIR